MQTTDQPLDVMIIGAGVAGLYQLHMLREQGLKVRAFDAAGGVGGTWYWNRYPGARFDSEAYIYQYLFSEELYKNWSWSSRFPPQPEIEQWMNYVADSLDLRRDIQLNTRIERADYDEDTRCWTVRTDGGEQITTRFLVTCCGMLSAALEEVFPGQESFQGQIFHTARWPKEEVALEGKRVGVVGIGATGIQVIQTIADQVANLKVFVRTPQYVIPMRNPSYGAEEVSWYKGRFEELRDKIPHTFAGFEYEFEHKWSELSPEQRLEVIEAAHADGSLRLWLGAFDELFFEADVAAEFSEFVRAKMRARLKDPALHELLIPTDYHFGSHRVPLESNYLEAYNRNNVQAISVRDNPITAVVPEGLQLADGTVHEFDVVILATGFDAGTGALSRIDIRGRNGLSLKDEWQKNIRTTMGLQVHGFPNLFTTAAPLAPSAALCNMTTCLQQQTEWISDCIAYLGKQGFDYFEPDRETEESWINHHDETAAKTLISRTRSWYNGANVAGKPSRVLSYTGGVGAYREKCDEVARNEYPGFIKA
jgi:cation diffusion facilitator CzcD-associated flavoprotein CzcO